MLFGWCSVCRVAVKPLTQAAKTATLTFVVGANDWLGLCPCTVYSPTLARRNCFLEGETRLIIQRGLLRGSVPNVSIVYGRERSRRLVYRADGPRCRAARV